MAGTTPFDTTDDFAARLPRRGRLLGLDLGSKTIGLAISDSQWSIAAPLEVIRRKKFTKDAELLRTLIAERDVVGLVFGWPLALDGSLSPRCQSTADFARNLVGLNFALPMTTFDERLSTKVVERELIEVQDMTRKRRGEVIDKLAASYQLQGALDLLILRQGQAAAREATGDKHHSDQRGE